MTERAQSGASPSNHRRPFLGPAASYDIAAATTIGLEPTRATNQDAYGYLTGRMATTPGAPAWAVVCVADGMGGMAAGDVASDVATRFVLSSAAQRFAAGGEIGVEEQARMTRGWARGAHDKVRAALMEFEARGGCALLCACLLDARLTIAHVGDCRLYRFPGGDRRLQREDPELLTVDHSLAMERLSQGEFSREQLRSHPDRSALTRSVGGETPRVDTLKEATGEPALELLNDDLLLLCSDGLWEPVTEEVMAAIVHRPGRTVATAANDLIAKAVEGGAADNATALLLRLAKTPAAGE